MAVITKGSAPEQTMVAAGGQLVVDARNIPVVRGGNRSSKTKADEVVIIPERKIVGFGKAVEIIQDDGVGPGCKGSIEVRLAGVRALNPAGAVKLVPAIGPPGH